MAIIETIQKSVETETHLLAKNLEKLGQENLAVLMPDMLVANRTEALLRLRYLLGIQTQFSLLSRPDIVQTINDGIKFFGFTRSRV